MLAPPPVPVPEGLLQPAMARQRSFPGAFQKKPPLVGPEVDVADAGGVGLDLRDDEGRPRSGTSITSGGVVRGGVVTAVGEGRGEPGGYEKNASRCGSAGEVGVRGWSVDFGAATYSIVASESSSTRSFA